MQQRYKRKAEALRQGRIRARSRRADAIEKIVQKVHPEAINRRDPAVTRARGRALATEQQSDIKSFKALEIRRALNKFFAEEPSNLGKPAKYIAHTLTTKPALYFEAGLPYAGESKLLREVAIALTVLRPRRRKT